MDQKQPKKVLIEELEDKLNDARTKNKALEKKIGKIDAEIHKLKTVLQSIADRLKVKKCQLYFIQLSSPVLCVQAPKQKKSIGTNTDSSLGKVSDASTQMPVLYLARRTGKVWYLSEPPNHVERKQQDNKRNIV